MSKKPKPASKSKKPVNPDQPFTIGDSYLIRTVTHYIAGRIASVGRTEIVMSDAAWIADTGRFSEALRTGTFNEQEPYPTGTVIVGRGSIVDATPVTLTYPLGVK